jgi:putative heme transporter
VRGSHIAIGVGGSIVVGALLVTGVGRLAGFARLGHTFEDADLRWLVVCFVGEATVFAGYAGAVRYALARDDARSFSYVAALQLVFASFAATQLFAFAGIGGLAVIFWALRREGFDRDEASVRLIGLNTAVYLVFGAVGWCSALWTLLTSTAPLGITIPWLATFPVLVALGRWFTEPPRAKRWTDVDQALVRRGLVRRGLAVGIGAAAWTRKMLVDRRRRTAFAWIGCYWVGDIASLWAALHAYGAAPGVPTVTIAYVTGYLAQSLPIPFIATAGVDAATAFLLQLLGVRLDIALAGVVTHRVFAFWLPVIPGSIFALTLPRLGRRLSPEPSVNAPPG